MNIKSEKFIVEMSHDELWDTTYDVRNAIEHTIRTHWINNPGVWEVNEKNRLQRFKSMCNALGRPDIYEELIKLSIEIFKLHNENP